MHLVIVMGKSDWCGGLSDKTSFSVWHLKTWYKQCPVCGTTWEGLEGAALLMEVRHQGQTLKISSPRPSPSVCCLCFLLFPNSAIWESWALACWPLRWVQLPSFLHLDSFSISHWKSFVPSRSIRVIFLVLCYPIGIVEEPFQAGALFILILPFI